MAFIVVLIAFASAAGAQYEVRVAPSGQDLALSLSLPPGSTQAVKLSLRGVAWGLKPQVSDVRCADIPLRQDAHGNWVAPAKCAAVTWHVIPDRVGPEGVDASRQRTLAVGNAPWFLLSEPTSLLRPHDFPDAATIRAARGSKRLVGATAVRPGAFRVPPDGSAPEFYVLGQVEVSDRHVGSFDVTYIADDTVRVKRLGLEALHASVLTSLSRVVLAPASSNDVSLLVIWLGVTESIGNAGGAAGSRSFIANYVVGSPDGDERNVAFVTMTVAHEQFHQLVDMTRRDLSLAPLQTWLSESLAQYYGLRALLAVDRSSAARDLSAEFIDVKRPVISGLLELNRRYAAGDRAVYPAFYSQGATLWQAIDEAIATATSGTKSLNDYLGDLVHAQPAADGSLPSAFLDQLRRAGGSKVDEILAKYVGK
jgi:hypothetical protein